MYPIAGWAVWVEQPTFRPLCDHKQWEFLPCAEKTWNEQGCWYVQMYKDWYVLSGMLIIKLFFNVIICLAESLAEVFTWLGFRVLMCKDQTKEKMDQALDCFASLSDVSQLQDFDVKEWSGSEFVDLQVHPKHGDAFICCILSHGVKSAVVGTDGEPLYIKQIIRTFKATGQSPLTCKPKVFLIQACQGEDTQRGVLLKGLQTDDCHSLSIPEEADTLVAIATVEDCVAHRHITEGSWFIQSLCQQLKEGCQRYKNKLTPKTCDRYCVRHLCSQFFCFFFSACCFGLFKKLLFGFRGEDLITILHHVNNEVSQKEAGFQPGERKQMPEVRFTLRKRLVLSPHTKWIIFCKCIQAILREKRFIYIYIFLFTSLSWWILQFSFILLHVNVKE